MTNRAPMVHSPAQLAQLAALQRTNGLRQPGQVYERRQTGVRPQSLQLTTGERMDLRRPSPAEMEQIRASTRVYVFPKFGTFNAGAGFTSSTQDVLQFRESGWIVGLTFEAVNLGTRAARTSLGVTLQVKGKGTAITSDSSALAPIPISLLCPELANGGQDVCPFVRHVLPNDALLINWQNFNAAGINIKPTGACLFVPDEDVPKGCRPDPVGTSLPPCTQFYLVPQFVNGVQVTPAAPIAAGSIGPDGIVTFLDRGLVTAFRADVMADTSNARAANAAIIESWGGKRDAVTSDTAASTFAQISLLAHGPEMALRLRRRVEIRDEVRVAFQNTDTNPWAPCAVFFVDVDADQTKRSLFE